MNALPARRSKYTGIVAAVALVGTLALTQSGVLDPTLERTLGSGALVGFPLLTALACWWCAVEMSSVAMKRQWVALGAAAVFFGAGQFLEEFTGLSNAEGFTIAKALYVLAIATFGAGVWMALRAFVGFLDVRRPIRISAIFAAMASVAGVAGLAGQFGHISGGLADKILLAAYPIGLLWLMAMPALALALTVSQMGSGALARPWWAVFVGVTLLALSNVVFVIVTALAIPLGNAGPVEFGWWIGLSCIAVGAAMQIDVQKPSMSAAE